MPKKLTYEYVKRYFEKEGCELLDIEYINNSTKMKYIAQCGHEHLISFANFRVGKCRYCPNCINEKTKEKLRFNFNFIEKTFSDKGCILLDKKYKGRNVKLSYIASCGHKHKVIFNNFLHHNRGIVCPKCAIKKNSGETHYNWGGNKIDRVKRSFVKETVSWRKKIFLKDNYTCQITGKKGGNLEAHHLKPYHKYKDIRFNIDNGITLNKEFHRFCHNLFGYRAEVGINKLKKAKLLWDNK